MKLFTQTMISSFVTMWYLHPSVALISITPDAEKALHTLHE